MIKFFAKLCLISVMGMMITSPAFSLPVLEEIKTTGLLKAATREDAVPFGYRDLNNNLSGFCLDLIELIRQEVIESLNQEIISIRLFKSSLFNRFELVEDRAVHLECGPNTIRPLTNRSVQFSEPFFVTGTQFLIKAEAQKKFDFNRSLEGVVIGVLKDSTNQKRIEERYPQATIREFLGITGRLRGIQALKEDRIDAFASDGILLIGESVLMGLVLGDDYLLVPSVPLECDYYGLILPNNDPQWKALIDRSIEKAREQQIFREWIGVIIPEIRDSYQYCRQQPR